MGIGQTGMLLTRQACASVKGPTRPQPHDPGGDEDAASPRVALDDGARELWVLRAVLKSFAAWDSFARGSERLLCELAGALGQIAGAFWLPRDELLTPGALWGASSTDRGELERRLGGLRIPSGVGLAGYAWERQQAVDRRVAAHVGRARRGTAPPDRLAAMIAFPCATGEEVLAVIELRSSNEVELSSRLRDALTSAGRDLGAFFARRRGELGQSPLSDREAQVMRLAAEGLSVRGIAESLTVSPATVKSHLEHIYRKLGVRGRAGAVAHALRTGIIE